MGEDSIYYAAAVCTVCPFVYCICSKVGMLVWSFSLCLETHTNTQYSGLWVRCVLCATLLNSIPVESINMLGHIPYLQSSFIWVCTYLYLFFMLGAQQALPQTWSSYLLHLHTCISHQMWDNSYTDQAILCFYLRVIMGNGVGGCLVMFTV